MSQNKKRNNNKKKDDYLHHLYYETGHFSGPQKLYQIVQSEGRHKISQAYITAWLKKQDAYTLHRPVQHRFPRIRVVTQGKDDLWDADLADVSNVAKYNDGVRFLLVAIDVFTRYLWVVPLKDKTGDSVVSAFATIFEEGRKPSSLRTDKGKEFTNGKVRQFLKKQGVNAFTAKNAETKANYAERVIRTLKGVVYRHFTYNETYRYVDVLDNLVKAYNERPHSSLPDGLSPAGVKKEAIVWKRMYVDTARQGRGRRPFKFNVGDKVRLTHVRRTFQRDHQEKWTEEVFVVARRYKKDGIPQYQVKDWADDEVEGSFYERELQPVVKTDDDLWKIEKILRRRKGRALVKWKGWPEKFNSWVDLISPLQQ